MKIDWLKNITSSLIGGILTILFNLYQLPAANEFTSGLGLRLSVPTFLFSSFITGFIIVFFATTILDLVNKK